MPKRHRGFFTKLNNTLFWRNNPRKHSLYILKRLHFVSTHHVEKIYVTQKSSIGLQCFFEHSGRSNNCMRRLADNVGHFLRFHVRRNSLCVKRNLFS